MSLVPDRPSLILLVLLVSGSSVHGGATKYKSEIMCDKYAESVTTLEEPPVLVGGDEMIPVDNCGIIEEPLIVGGELAKSKEFPHMALIGFGEEVINWLCGGTLISDTYILSAAHCASSEKGPARWATVGDLRVLEEGEEADPVTAEIVERIVHPEYSPSQVYHDVALFKLKKPLKFSPYIRPACLHRSYKIAYAKPIASGWGHTSWGGEPTQDLMKVSLPLVNVSVCNSSFKSKDKLPRGIDDTSMLCAGGVANFDTCQGDSGGPLQFPMKSPYCMYAVVGVTSFGEKCAKGKPGVYARVSYYAPWIESIVWK